MELSEEKDTLTAHISREGATTVAYGFMMFSVFWLPQMGAPTLRSSRAGWGVKSSLPRAFLLAWIPEFLSCLSFWIFQNIQPLLDSTGVVVNTCSPCLWLSVRVTRTYSEYARGQCSLNFTCIITFNLYNIFVKSVKILSPLHKQRR